MKEEAAHPCTSASRLASRQKLKGCEGFFPIMSGVKRKERLAIKEKRKSLKERGLSFHRFLTVPLRATAIPRSRTNKGSPVEIQEFSG
jgi:hypothetical protein